MTTWVLDAYAVIAWVQGEPGAGYVKRIMLSAGRGGAAVYICVVSLGEVFYSIWRRRGESAAVDVRTESRELPWTVVPVDEALTWHAASFKAQYPISYADAFAVALADRLGATLVTNDPEIRRADLGVSVEWLDS